MKSRSTKAQVEMQIVKNVACREHFYQQYRKLSKSLLTIMDNDFFFFRFVLILALLMTALADTSNGFATALRDCT